MAAALLKRIETIETIMDQRENAVDAASLVREWYETRYDWQREFIKTTSEFSESCLCAANRVDT